MVPDLHAGTPHHVSLRGFERTTPSCARCCERVLKRTGAAFEGGRGAAAGGAPFWDGGGCGPIMRALDNPQTELGTS